MLFTFSEEPDGDHIFVKEHEDSQSDVATGRVFFKRTFVKMGGAEWWDGVCAALLRMGVEEVNEEFMQELDRQAYAKEFGEPVMRRVNEIVAPIDFYTPHKLTPRQEETITYLRTLLDGNFITPHDFEEPGDLIIRYD